MLKIETCCFGIPIEAGGTLIGIFSFITSLLAILLRIFAWTNVNIRDLYCPDRIPELCYEETAWTRIFNVIWFISHICIVITASYLLNGIPVKNRHCVRPFIIINLIHLLLNIMLVLAYGMGTKYLILTCFGSLIIIYFVIVLISLHKKFNPIRNEDEF